jgi:DNA polymerase-1
MVSVLTKEKFNDFLGEAKEDINWVVDVETNGLDSYEGSQLCGVGVGLYRSNKTWYFPFRHQQGSNLDIDLLEPLMELMSTRKSLIGHNLKFDIHFLVKDGLDITNVRLVDTLVMCRITEPTTERKLGLTDMLVKRFGNSYGEYDLETKRVLRANKWNKDFSLSPHDLLGPYCEIDVSSTNKLFKDCLRRIKVSKQEKIWQLQIELTKVLFKMEHRGIKIDNAYAKTAIERLDKRRGEVSKEIFDLVGYEFKILSSTKAVTEAMETVGIRPTRVTPKGNPSWSEEALIATQSKLGGLIAQYRNLSKLQATYLEPYVDKDVMHTIFKNWGTVTGRLSSASPNLQNIPREFTGLSGSELTTEQKDELLNRLVKNKFASPTGWESEALQAWSFLEGDKSDDSTQVTARRIVIPRQDYNMVSFDYSQMEVRMFLVYVGQPEMLSLMKQGGIDFHSETAKIAFQVTEDHPEWDFYRQAAKNITFGVIYGIGKNKLAHEMGVTPIEAFRYKKQYFENMKGSREFFNRVVNTIQTRGWVRNKYGRIYKIGNPEWGYKAVNYLVQGTSAEILSERMVEIDKFLSAYKSNLLVQIHDEIIVEIHKDEMALIPSIQTLLQENSLGMDLEVDVELCAPSWATKKKLDEAKITIEDPVFTEELVANVAGVW